METPTKRTQELFLSLSKRTVSIVMGLALLFVVALVVTAVYQYSKSPKEPKPAQKAPIREIGRQREIQFEDLIRFLTEKEKRGSNAGPLFEQKSAWQPTLRFLDDAVALYGCSIQFSRAVGADLLYANDAANAQLLEEIRDYIEKQADASSLRGEVWVKAMIPFTCDALVNPTIIELRKEQKVRNVFVPVIDFHAAAWDAIRREKIEIASEREEFEKREKNRVAAERVDEALRVADAKALAVTCLITAAIIFGLFMLLAIYLLAAKIENELRAINKMIRSDDLRKMADVPVR